MISIPPAEVSRHALSGSIVPAAEILEHPVSPELTLAFGLLRSAYGDAARLQVCVRPEMFTHGSTLAWLQGQIAPARTHLCLSDGEAVRVVPGMANSVFFYRIGHASGVEGFLRLRRRAPELLAGLASQVNTALAMAAGQRRKPRTTTLPPRTDGEEGVFLPFYSPRGPVQREARELASQSPVTLPALPQCTYAAVSDAALQNVSFAAGLINEIIDAYTHPERMLVIGSPLAADPEDALATLFVALRRHAFALPSGMPSNVFVHLGGGGALPAAAFGGQSRLVAYEADGFWQRSIAFYASFGAATVLREPESPHHSAGLHAVLKTLTGRVWAEASLPRAENTSLARYRW